MAYPAAEQHHPGGRSPDSPDAAGLVVAICAGHRCAALGRISGAGSLAPSVARSSGGVLISAPCLQQCAEGPVGAVAVRAPGAQITGPSVWLGGLDTLERLTALGTWVEGWQAAGNTPAALPAELAEAVIGTGPPLRLSTRRS